MRSLRSKLIGQPSPQSEQARAAGCICRWGPRVNGRQRWVWFDTNCPVHAAALLAAFGKETA